MKIINKILMKNVILHISNIKIMYHLEKMINLIEPLKLWDKKLILLIMLLGKKMILQPLLYMKLILPSIIEILNKKQKLLETILLSLEEVKFKLLLTLNGLN